MKPRLRVLVVDDEPSMVETIRHILRRSGIDAGGAANGAEALAALEREHFDLMLTDARMPGMDGYQLLERAKARWPDMAVAVMTAYATPQLAVRAIRAGAEEYLAKPFDPEEILHLVSKIEDRRRLLEENRRLRGQLSGGVPVDAILGESAAMSQVRESIRMVAPSEAIVLIVGETGTGKELVARAIHGGSARAERAFVSINSAAIPESLLESELFGHARGAFTGAQQARDGRLVEADHGTLFLDEIGDMPPALQAKLLRVIEEMRFSPVGENRAITVDVRFVAATHRDLPRRMQEGRFREDLYHRLNVFRIELAPLRERPEDIMPLAAHFLRSFCQSMGKKCAGFAPGAEAAMRAYAWPGNVRELRNAIERAVILERGDSIAERSLPREITESGGARDGSAERQGAVQDSGGTLDARLARHERELVESALAAHAGSLAAAARDLGLSRHALRYRMQKLGMDRAAAEDAGD